MKNGLMILILISCFNSIYAMCGMAGISFFPQTEEIGLNSMFIISGYAYSQKTILSFKKRNVFLESDNGDIVGLCLEEIHVGQKRLTQAVFKPAADLKPNSVYHLKFEKQTDEETKAMMKWNSNKKQREMVTWKTNRGNAIPQLTSNLNITYKNTEVTHYGCGPAAFAVFDIDRSEEAEIWYRTELVHLATNEKAKYFITDRKGSLHVGHGMCSGAFTYVAKGAYKVRFTPMTIDGQILKSTEWYKFDSPYMHDKNPPTLGLGL